MTMELEFLEIYRRDVRSDDPDVRQRVAWLLAERKEPGAGELLLELLGDRDWRVRKTAVDALSGRVSDRILQALVQALRDEGNAGRRNSASDALVRFGRESLPFLLYEVGRENPPDFRIAVAGILGGISEPESVPALVAMMQRDEDVNVVAACITALGKLGRAEAVPALVEVLGGANPWLHYHAIESLGQIGSPEALPAIIACYENTALRKPIVEAVGQIGSLATVDFLSGLLASAPRVDLAILRAFTRIDRLSRPVLVADRERAYLRRKFREAFGAERVPELLSLLKKTERADRRRDILRALGWSGHRDALPVLIAYLSLPEFSDVAEEALGDFGPGAEEVLIPLLTLDADEEAAAAAIRILIRRASARVLPALRAITGHDSPALRRGAVEALGKLGDRESVDALMARLADADAGVDVAAVAALWAIASSHPDLQPALVQHLIERTDSEDPLARANSLTLLSELGSGHFEARLLVASKDRDAVVRARAVSLAGRLESPAVRTTIRHALTDENPQVRQAALVAVAQAARAEEFDAVLAGLSDEDLWVRQAGARSLGRFGNPKAVGPLLLLLAQGEPPERIAALESLGALDGPQAAEGIRKGLRDPDIEIRQSALAAMALLTNPSVDGEIEQFLDDEDWRLRATALEAVGRRRRRDLLPRIHERLLRDPDDLVARAALSAVEEIRDPASLPVLIEALERKVIVDDVVTALVRLAPVFGRRLSDAWRQADRRREPILAEILRTVAAAPPA
jgi:HEAT repeat protein